MVGKSWIRNSVSNAVSNAEESGCISTNFSELKVLQFGQIWTEKRLGEQGIWK